MTKQREIAKEIKTAIQMGKSSYKIVIIVNARNDST